MEFPGLGAQPVRKFNGLYKVIMVRNSFSGGQFTQRLETIRRRAQDVAAELAAVQSTGAVQIGDADRQIAQTPESGESGSGTSQGGTGGQASQGTPTRGTEGYGEGQVDPRINRAATQAEATRISNVQSARANGANIGF